MCGINGFVDINNLEPDLLERRISVMNDKIIHRGPDEDGELVYGNTAIGMRRLSIIDLNTGKQPIFNETG